MADEKENGILSRLFGTQKSSCCGMRIEEITEEKDAESTKEEIENIPPIQQSSCCCGQCAPEDTGKQS